MRVLFSAIRTLRQFKTSLWDWNGVVHASDIDRASFNLPRWETVAAPLPWPQLRGRLAAHNIRLQHRIDTFEPVGDVRLSIREFNENADKMNRQLVRYWDAALQAGGFQARAADGSRKNIHTINWPEDGNSLWHCLTYINSLSQVHYDHPGDWMLMKARIWKYFNYVIHHPRHWRHRLYVHLERQSWTEIERLKPGSERIWGRMSILRALHLNIPDSGPPMYGNFQGMMQVIADYFGKEVILFIRPGNAVNGDPPEYDYRVFGSRTNGQVNGQLYFVSDVIPEQYQVVTHLDNVPVDYSCRLRRRDPHKPGLLDTSHRSADDRFGWINAPWMPPRPLPAQWEPRPLKTTPILDPSRYHVANGSAEWDQFAGLGVALDDDARYGNGAVPVLPDPVTAGWQTERMARLPGAIRYPEFPYGFGNRKIVTGVYEDANGREWWPQWNNLSAYRAHQFRQLAIERDLPTTPHTLSQP
ncbi:hypothetical protein F4860DRAFT_458052 [Xylaria cubensis]|nr:hypothetical protein F4860DRAFT_458052 [Xylaria cubensis]